MSSYSDSRTSRWVEDQNRRPRLNREYRTRGGTIIPDRSSMSPPSRSGSLIEQDHHDDDDDDDDSDRSTVKDNSRAVILYPSSAGESGLFGDEPDSGSATVDHSGYLVSLDQQTPQSHHGQSVHDSSPPPPPPPPPYERSASAVSGHLPHYHDRTPAAPRVLARCGRSVSATFRPPVPSHQPEPPLPEVHTQHGSSSLAPGEFIYTTQVKIVFSEESGRPSPHRKHRRRSTTTRGATHE